MKKVLIILAISVLTISVKSQVVAEWNPSYDMSLQSATDTIIHAPTATQNPNPLLDISGLKWACECDVQNLNKPIRISIGGGNVVLGTLQHPVYPSVYYNVYSFNSLPTDSFPYTLNRTTLARKDNTFGGVDSVFTKSFADDNFYFPIIAIKVYKDSTNTTGVFNIYCKFYKR